MAMAHMTIRKHINAYKYISGLITLPPSPCVAWWGPVAPPAPWIRWRHVATSSKPSLPTASPECATPSACPPTAGCHPAQSMPTVCLVLSAPGPASRSQVAPPCLRYLSLPFLAVMLVLPAGLLLPQPLAVQLALMPLLLEFAVLLSQWRL